MRTDPKPDAPTHYQLATPSPWERKHNIGLCRNYWSKLTTDPSQVTCRECRALIAFGVNLALSEPA